jgi:intracellular sulfur oxidation DsrE/DsrF family protein
MKWKRISVGVTLAVLLLAITGCAVQNVPVPAPTPPQVTLANSVNLLAQSLHTAHVALVAARDAGTISQADLNTAEDVIVVIATTGKQVNAELNSLDTWDVQKAKIRQLCIQAAVNATAKKLPPTAAAILEASYLAFNQISAMVGGGVL